MLRFIFLYASLMFSVHIASAQLYREEASQFWNTRSHYNPAFSGFFHDYHGSIFYSNATYGLNGNVRLKNHHGIGGYLMSDRWRFRYGLNYNYQWNIAEGKRLSVGASFGVTDLGLVFVSVPSDSGTWDINDATNLTYISGGLGVAYRGERFYAGVGAQNVYASRIYTSETEPRLKPMYNVLVGFLHPFTSSIALHTRGMLYTDLNRYYGQVNATVFLQDNLFGFGASLYPTRGFGLNATLNPLTWLSIGYQFSLNDGDLIHQIAIRLEGNFKK